MNTIIFMKNKVMIINYQDFRTKLEFTNILFKSTELSIFCGNL